MRAWIWRKLRAILALDIAATHRRVVGLMRAEREREAEILERGDERARREAEAHRREAERLRRMEEELDAYVRAYSGGRDA
jgi:hypothetical protein